MFLNLLMSFFLNFLKIQTVRIVPCCQPHEPKCWWRKKTEPLLFKHGESSKKVLCFCWFYKYNIGVGGRWPSGRVLNPNHFFILFWNLAFLFKNIQKVILCRMCCVEWQHLVHSLVTSALDPKVDHRVGQTAAHVELQGEVVHTLRVLWKQVEQAVTNWRPFHNSAAGFGSIATPGGPSP